MANDDSRLINSVAHMVLMRIGAPTFIWRFLGYPLNCPEAISVSKFFDKALKSVMEKAEHTYTNAREMNVLDRLLANEDTLSQQEIHDEIIAFFAAGHETTSRALSSLLMEISRRPDVQDKIRQELKTFKFTDQPFTMDDLGHFKYLEKVIKETLRLHSVVQMTARFSLEPVEVLGQVLPKNSMFQIFIGGLHINPKYWDRPMEFDPDRWDKPIVPGSYMPFGDGPRICIGQKMALIEIKTTMIQLLKKFKVSSSQEPVFEMILTRGLVPGFKIKFEALD